MCCPPLIFKPSLGRREKLAKKVGRKEIYRPVPPPSLNKTVQVEMVKRKTGKKRSLIKVSMKLCLVGYSLAFIDAGHQLPSRFHLVMKHCVPCLILLERLK